MPPRHILHALLIAALAPAALAMSGGAGTARSSASPPSILALLEPPDGAVVHAGSRPTFAWEATPGGRFRVEFSSSRDPFIPTLNSGRRTTPGDRFKPSAMQWRMILGLAGAASTVHWRVVALGMSDAEIAAAPVASFSVSR